MISSKSMNTQPPDLPHGIKFFPGITYGRIQGLELKLDLARPSHSPGDPLPAVVFIHGGGWSSADRSNGHRIITLLAQNGFVAASIDYRLSGESSFPAQLEDSKCAVRFLRAHAGVYGIDPQRIGTAGGSAGGHLAALVALTPANAGLEGTGGWEEFSSHVSAVVDFYGVSDLLSLAANPRSSSMVLKLMRGTPAEKPALYRQANPLGLVQAGAPPFYLAHGDKDDLVPLDQSERLAAALQDAGSEATLRVIQGMAHGSIGTLPEEVLADMVAFFKKHLAGT